MGMELAPHLRVARPTDDLAAVTHFYREGLGLTVLGSFADHAGFDGIMLGLPDGPYHLEFTQQHDHVAGRAPTADNLLVFYLPDQATWQQVVDRMRAAGYTPVLSANPYWDVHGLTFADPDGYRVVLQQAPWP